MNKTINHYNLKATDFFSQYESETADTIHSRWASHQNGTDGLPEHERIPLWVYRKNKRKKK